jgi:N-acetylneuraminic acid mutarotase
MPDTNTALTRRALIAASGAGLVAGCSSGQHAASVPYPAGPGCWTAQPPLPFAVQEIYPAAHKGRIHLAGGLLGEGGRVVGVSDRHVSHDPVTGAAATLSPLPWRRHHPQLVSHGGALYLLGGFGSSGAGVTWEIAADALRHDPASDSWIPLASSPSPHAECVSASFGGRIHLVGGRVPRGTANRAYGDHADSTQHLVFDPGANSWTTDAPALTARNSAAGAVINGLWHVAGGRSMAGGPSDAHEVYDPREDRWRAAAPMPAGSGAGGNAAAALGGMLVVVGGEVFGANGAAGVVHPEVWRYDPRADTWTALAPMPTPRHGLGAVVLDGAIWTVGGAKKPSGVETSATVERFTFGGCP